MKNLILRTDTRNASLFIARIGVALVILPHGLQKAFGVFGGYGFESTMQYFTETVGVPWIVGFLVIVAESLGALMLAAGLLSRFVSASLILVMVGAAAQHAGNGFFMNWFADQRGEGVEFFILAISLFLPVAIFGGGKWSVDGLMTDRFSKKDKLKFDANFETSL